MEKELGSLLVTRRKGESIIIGNNDIEITVINSNNFISKILINAPKNISVYRREIFERIIEQNKGYMIRGIIE